MDTSKSSVQRLKTTSRQIAPQVTDILRQRIISLQLEPGCVLSRNELQDEFGLSSTPIRDALMRLQEEGLVEIFPQRATVVSPIDLPKARQSQFLRRALEQEAVRVIAAAPGKGLIKRLKDIIAQQKALAAHDEFDAFTEADQTFHRALYEAAGVPGLWELMRRNSGHTDRIRRLYLPLEGKMAQIVREHTAIVKALAGKDPDGAREAIRAHLSSSIGRWEDMQQKLPTYFRN